jgi:hypothetical protein
MMEASGAGDTRNFSRTSLQKILKLHSLSLVLDCDDLFFLKFLFKLKIIADCGI